MAPVAKQIRGPLQTLAFPSMARNNSPLTLRSSPKKSPPQDSHTQWVIVDKSPVKIFNCSVALDLLHTCERCDKDFATVERLMDHMKNCASTRPSPLTGTLKARRELRITKSPLEQESKSKISRILPGIKRKLEFTTSLPARAKCNVITQTSKKNVFLSCIGLSSLNQHQGRSQSSAKGERRKQKLPNKMLKAIPFTHLPDELHLRNFSFQQSSRLEAFNAEKIASNWKKVDSVCPAYPMDHRRYLPFIPKNQSFKIVDPADDSISRPRRRITASKLITLPGEQEHIGSKRAPARSRRASVRRLTVHILRLSPQDIKLAEQGISIEAITNTYKGHTHVTTTSKTEKAAATESPKRPPSCVVSLERIPSNLVALGQHSPIKASCLRKDEQSKTPSRPSVIKFCGGIAPSPRRLLPSTISVVEIDDDSDDEVICIGHFVKK